MNDSDVIPGATDYAESLQSAADAADPIYQRLRAEIQADGTVILPAADPEGPARTGDVVARVVVDIVREAGDEIRCDIYPATTVPDLIPEDAAVGIAKMSLVEWERAWRQQHGLDDTNDPNIPF